MYHSMAKHISAATTVIDHLPSAASEIDRVLSTMLRGSRPVYIGLSIDTAYELWSDHTLEIPLVRALPSNDLVM
jgi:pyruvate decarboxylase